jgi:rubrerythrin
VKLIDTHRWFGWVCLRCGTTTDRPEANKMCAAVMPSATPEGKDK